MLFLALQNIIDVSIFCFFVMFGEDILKAGGICSDAFSPEYFSKDCRLELFDCLKIVVKN